MKIITTASYYGTGSSAVTDLLSEYENVKSLGSNFECRIAHDMFGLSDLEYYLVDNYHRHNSSVAINMFKRLMGIYGLDKKLRMEDYPYYLGPNFEKGVKEYIDDLTELTFKGGAHTDIYMMSNFIITLLKIRERIYRKFHKLNINNDDSSWAHTTLSPYGKLIRSCDYNISYPKEYFLEVTKKFTRKIFSGDDENSTGYLMIDQLVSPANTMRYVRYFDEIKVVCVDRDPRDVYYNEKVYWKGGVVPSDTETFVRWFKSTRAHKEYEIDNPNYVKRIFFEDLILDYERMVGEIEKFLDIDPSLHTKPLTFLNPSISIKNIHRWKNDKSEWSNIEYIEKELPELCQRSV